MLGQDQDLPLSSHSHLCFGKKLAELLESTYLPHLGEQVFQPPDCLHCSVPLQSPGWVSHLGLFGLGTICPYDDVQCADCGLSATFQLCLVCQLTMAYDIVRADG